MSELRLVILAVLLILIIFGSYGAGIYTGHLMCSQTDYAIDIFRKETKQ